MKNLRLVAPAELIIGQLEKSPAFGKERNLPPSRNSFYLDALRCYGYSHHFAEDTITIEEDGTAQVEHRCLMLITATASLDNLSMKFRFDGAVTAAEIINAQVYSIPTFGETMSDSYQENLRDIFNQARQPAGFQLHESILLGSHEAMEGDLKKIKFSWRSPEKLPGYLKMNGMAAEICAVRVHLRISVVAGAFRVPTANTPEVPDTWHRLMAIPCGQYDLRLHIKGGVQLEIAHFHGNVSFWGQRHPTETKRLEKLNVNFTPNSREVSVYHPLTNSEYIFEWTVWRR